MSMNTTPLFRSALLVEDEKNLSITLQIALKKAGIPEIQTVTTIAEAREKIRSSTPEFVLLDRNLPDGDGLTLCSELRSPAFNGFAGAILMLTSVGETEDRVQGLNAGADDYLAKPFSWAELEARIRAISRRKTAC